MLSLHAFGVTSAGRDAWKARCGASLLDYTKLKKETEPYLARELYIHGDAMLNNTAQLLRLVGSSPLGLGPSHMPVRSRISAYP